MGAPVRKRPPKSHPDRDSDYLAHIRAHDCCMRWAGGCAGEVIPHHHGKSDGGGGVSLKANDFYTLPICNQHHVEFHGGTLTRHFETLSGSASDALEAYFSREMVRCLAEWCMGGSVPSKIVPRGGVF